MNTRDEYALARDAQNRRYESVTGLSVADAGRQEYRDYFGVGDYAGKPVESRVNYRDWLISHRVEREPVDCVTAEQAFTLSGAQLAVLALAGDYVAKDEIVRRWIKRAGVAA